MGSAPTASRHVTWVQYKSIRFLPNTSSQSDFNFQTLRPKGPQIGILSSRISVQDLHRKACLKGGGNLSEFLQPSFRCRKSEYLSGCSTWERMRLVAVPSNHVNSVISHLYVAVYI